MKLWRGREEFFWGGIDGGWQGILCSLLVFSGVFHEFYSGFLYVSGGFQVF